MGEYTALSTVYSLQLFIQYSPVNEFRYIPCLKQSRWSGRGLVSWLQSSQTFHGLHLSGPSDRHRNRIASGTIQIRVCRVLVFLQWSHRPDWALGLYQLQTHLWRRLEALTWNSFSPSVWSFTNVLYRKGIYPYSEWHNKVFHWHLQYITSKTQQKP